jgi:flagellar biosynthetic protein FlhB
MAEKTEAPTPRRREEARAKGQGIGRSWEFSMGLTLGVGTLALASLLPAAATTLVARTQEAVIYMNPHASNSDLIGATGTAITTTLFLVLPLACLVLIAGVAGNLVSGGLVFSYRAVRFDLSRINPITGMKRLFDRQALIRLGLATTKLAILAFMSWQVVGSRIPSIVASQGQSASDIAGTCLSAIFQLGLTITILLAIVALADFVIQRRRAMESIRMTKEEVKQEYREQEGDPQIRGARRRRARQLAFARMMDAVPTADVVVTNPTTLAVALKYDSLSMKAPRVVAKGQRLMAERIKKIARENRVPVVEDKPLARALFPRPVGSEIPAHLYRAVARLLVLVHQARFAGAAGQRSGGGRAATWTADRARGAASGMAARPWWAGSGSAPLAAIEATAGTAAGYAPDADSAARAYGARDGDAAATGEAGNRLGGGVLDPADVDEDALAVAMSEDELGDITPEEIARYEAEMVLGDDQAADGDVDEYDEEVDEGSEPGDGRGDAVSTDGPASPTQANPDEESAR